LTQSEINYQHIQANGLTFYVGASGSGPRLFFISGSNGDLRKDNSPLLTPLTNNFELLSYDQRGMGQSDKPDLPYTMLDYASDAAAILDAMGWQNVDVVGYSFGGMVAQELAIGWPDKVNRLALLATTAGGAGGSSYPIQEFVELSPVESARRSLEVADLTFTAQWQKDNPDEANKKIALRMKSQSMFADEPNAASGQQRQLQARAKHDTYDRLPTIKQPTLVLAGNRDGQAPVKSQRAMASQIPNCQFKQVNGSHAMLWENNEAVKELITFIT